MSPELASGKVGELRMGTKFAVEPSLDRPQAADPDAVVLNDRVMNSDRLRRPEAIEFVKTFRES